MRAYPLGFATGGASPAPCPALVSSTVRLHVAVQPARHIMWTWHHVDFVASK